MKKILFMFSLLFVLAVSGIAQTLSTFTGTDTVTNTATVNLTLSVRGSYDNVVFQVVNTKLSGTAAGTSILYGSVDGINYKAIGTDTLTNTNQTTNFHQWRISNPDFPYYKIATVGSGTMSVITSAKAHFKKK